MSYESLRPRWHHYGILLIAWLAAVPVRAEADPLAGTLAPPSHPASLGAGVGRTMRLLSTSTPEHRNQVRILFYGQSITEQEWWRQVVADLRRRFPHADLVVENRAIGGFPSQQLIKPAEHDIFAFYPDLVIFHVYGSDKHYEEIIRAIRSRTTAEVLMQTDHITKWPPAKIAKWRDGGAWWEDRMNRQILPWIAQTYGCGLVDVRSDWLQYLRDNHLEPSALLLDDVHLNAAGCDLMARLVERYLVVPTDAADAGTDPVRTEPVGANQTWVGGKFTTAFEGNRLDLVAGPVSDPAQTLSVRVDGKKPSEFAELYTITRPEPRPWSALALVRVNHDRPLVAEDWTLTVDTYNPAQPPSWTYHVVGSVTGPDGSGTSGATFVSPSGRVRIEPDFWFSQQPVEPGYAIRWSVQPQFVDVYLPPPAGDPTLERATTLVRGLSNGPHTLELTAGAAGPPPIAAIRVYQPPFTPTDPRIVRSLVAVGIMLFLVGLWWSIRSEVAVESRWSRLVAAIRRPRGPRPERSVAS